MNKKTLIAPVIVPIHALLFEYIDTDVKYFTLPVSEWAAVKTVGTVCFNIWYPARDIEVVHYMFCFHLDLAPQEYG